MQKSSFNASSQIIFHWLPSILSVISTNARKHNFSGKVEINETIEIMVPIGMERAGMERSKT